LGVLECHGGDQWLSDDFDGGEDADRNEKRCGVDCHPIEEDCRNDETYGVRGQMDRRR
jgi:hypothetical protein